MNSQQSQQSQFDFDTLPFEDQTAIILQEYRNDIVNLETGIRNHDGNFSAIMTMLQEQTAAQKKLQNELKNTISKLFKRCDDYDKTIEDLYKKIDNLEYLNEDYNNVKKKKALGSASAGNSLGEIYQKRAAPSSNQLLAGPKYGIPITIPPPNNGANDSDANTTVANPPPN